MNQIYNFYPPPPLYHKLRVGGGPPDLSHIGPRGWGKNLALLLNVCNLIFIFSRTKQKQEEELKLLCEVYRTAAIANLRQAEFWKNMSVKYNFVPEVLPPGLMELSRLSSAEYQPNLGNIPERLFFFVGCFFPKFNIFYSYLLTKVQKSTIFCIIYLLLQG
jgi:hypothetical protein